MPGDRTFSVAEAARYLGVRVDEIYRLLRSGKLEGKKIRVAGLSKQVEWMIPAPALKAWKRSSRRRSG